MVRRFSAWFNANLPLALAGLVYIFCTIFVVVEIMNHGKIFGLSDSNRIEPEKSDLHLFSIVLLLMVAAGFTMLIVAAGKIIDGNRLQRENETAYARLSSRIKAIETTIDGIAILDKFGFYTYVNKAHATYYGYDEPREMVGMSWQSLYKPKRLHFFLNEVFPVLERTGEWTGQSVGLKRNGAEFPQELSLKKLDDGGLTCIVRDISEKVSYDRVLKIIKLAVEAASDGIAITDEDNNVLFMNRSFLKIHGYDPYTRERYIGTDWRNFYNEKGQELINSIVLPTTILKGAWSGSLTVMRKDGTLFYGDASLTRLPDGLTIGVMRDISERYAADKEKEELKEQLFHSQKMEAISRITGRLVTDFQGALDSIVAAMETWRSDRQTEQSQKEMIENIRGECKKAQELVDELQAFFISKGSKASSLNIAECLQEMEEELVELCPPHISIAIDLKSGDARVLFNAEQLQQIIRNLCLNSIEAIDAQPGRIVVSIRPMDRNLLGLRRQMISQTEADRNSSTSVRTKVVSGTKGFLMSGYLSNKRNYIELVVSDTGPGISSEILPNIFDPFFTTKALSKGTGLGLSTVQGYVAGSSGAIIVETLHGQGTGVHIYIPIAEDPEGMIIQS